MTLQRREKRQRRRFWHVLLVGFALLVLPAHALFASSCIDDLGRKVDIKPVPRRIVSLAPHITEILFDLGVGDRVVGVTQYSDYPPEASGIPRVGSYVRLNLEKIVSLAPDLVLSTSDGNPREAVLRLSKIGIPVFVLSPPSDLEGIFASILTIGVVTQREEAARKVVEGMRARVARVHALLKGAPPRKVFYQLGEHPLMSVGGGSFLDRLIERAGGRNIFHEIMLPYPRVSREEVLAAAPEVIIISSMAKRRQGEAARRSWKRWPMIPAVRKDAVYFISPDRVHRPGPRIVEGLERLASAIHPERFPR